MEEINIEYFLSKFKGIKNKLTSLTNKIVINKKDTYLENLTNCEENELVAELLNKYDHDYITVYYIDLISTFNIDIRSDKLYSSSDFIPILKDINTTTDELKEIYYLKDKLDFTSEYGFEHMFRCFLECIAIHPNTPIEIINELLEIDSEVLNIHLCRNPRLTVNVIKKLFKSNYKNYLANNISTPKGILSYYLKNNIAKYYLATNIAAPKYILNELSCDKESYIARVSAETLEKKSYLRKDKDLLTVYWYHNIRNEPFKDCLDMIK